MRDFALIVIGFVSGVSSALFGIGGAVISTPGIRALGVSALASVGSTLPPIFPSSVVLVTRYARAKLIDWRVVRLVSVTSIFTAVVGSAISHSFPGRGHVQMLCTAALLAYSGWRVMVGEHDVVAKPNLTAQARSVTCVLIGLVTGLFSGFLGVGSALITLPTFRHWLDLPTRRLIATSLACGGIVATVATIAHTFVGDIDWRVGILLSLGVAPGAYIGSNVSLRLSDKRLHQFFGIFLVVTALVFGAMELNLLFK